MEKTFLIPIGTQENCEPYVSPVPVTQEFTLLGMKIDNKLENLTGNFDLVISKMLRTVNFWARFGLTLPGRIAITKTFLLSQLNHLGCFLMPQEPQLNRMQEICDRFCQGKLRIAKSRLYLSYEEGGIGLINLKDFLVAQHVLWFKRAGISTRDNWRCELYNLGMGNLYAVNPNKVDEIRHPILQGLSKSFWYFLDKFNRLPGNLQKSFVFNNPLILRNATGPGILDLNFFRAGNCNFYRLSQMSFNDFWDNNGFRSLSDLNTNSNLMLSYANYFNLRSSLLPLNKKKENPNETELWKPKSVDEFLKNL